MLEHRLHCSAHLGVVNAGLGAEDDRAALTAPEAAKVLVKGLEATLGLGVGDVECGVEGGADPEHGAEHDDDHAYPDGDDLARVSEAPDTQASEHQVRLTSLGRRAGQVSLLRWKGAVVRP